MMPYLLLFLILIPIIEIYLFIEIGGAIGGFPTVLIVIITAVLGAYLLKREGLSILKDFSAKSVAGDNVSAVILEGLMVLFAGALLLTPGFMTDGVGFLLIMPYTRKYIGRYLVAWFMSRFTGGFSYYHKAQRNQGQDDDIIDVEYEEIGKGDKDE